MTERCYDEEDDVDGIHRSTGNWNPPGGVSTESTVGEWEEEKGKTKVPDSMEKYSTLLLGRVELYGSFGLLVRLTELTTSFSSDDVSRPCNTYFTLSQSTDILTSFGQNWGYLANLALWILVDIGTV